MSNFLVLRNSVVELLFLYDFWLALLTSFIDVSLFLPFLLMSF